MKCLINNNLMNTTSIPFYHGGFSPAPILKFIESEFDTSKFKELNRKERVFSNINKWSPADFYMISGDMGDNDWKLIKSCATIKSFNQIMIRLIKDKKLM